MWISSLLDALEFYYVSTFTNSLLLLMHRFPKFIKYQFNRFLGGEMRLKINYGWKIVHLLLSQTKKKDRIFQFFFISSLYFNLILFHFLKRGSKLKISPLPFFCLIINSIKDQVSKLLTHWWCLNQTGLQFIAEDTLTQCLQGSGI